MAFYLLRRPKEEVERLADAIRDVKDRITFCKVCNNLTEINENPCRICSSPGRDRALICVVEEPYSLVAVEKTRSTKACITFCTARCPRFAGSDRTN